MLTDLSGGFLVFVILMGLLIIVLWILLPFAIFGMKAKLDAQTAELVRLRQNFEWALERFFPDDQPPEEETKT